MSNCAVATPERVAAVRAFNRFWTKQIGILHAGLLRTSYSLTEARVLFELGQGGAMDVAELRRMLELDPGYLSRILASFKSSKLVTTGASEKDARRQVVRLTSKGRNVFETLDFRSVEDVRSTLSRLSEDDQRRVVGAMQCIGKVLGESSPSQAFVLRGLGPGDLGWVVQRHGVLYAEEYGWDESFEALVARIVADYVDKRAPWGDGAWIAEMDGEPVGCVFCVRKDARTAQLRLLLTDPKARGKGIGSRLVEECIRFARRAGYGRIVLWTNHPLRAARRIYERAGFVLEKEEEHHSFGHDLVGQSFALDLTRAPASTAAQKPSSATGRRGHRSERA